MLSGKQKNQDRVQNIKEKQESNWTKEHYTVIKPKFNTLFILHHQCRGFISSGPLDNPFIFRFRFHFFDRDKKKISERKVWMKKGGVRKGKWKRRVKKKTAQNHFWFPCYVPFSTHFFQLLPTTILPPLFIQGKWNMKPKNEKSYRTSSSLTQGKHGQKVKLLATINKVWN